MVSRMNQPSNAEIDQTDEMLSLIVDCPPEEGEQDESGE